jgi:protein involved in polysaccharide export with SLBB domain
MKQITFLFFGILLFSGTFTAQNLQNRDQQTGYNTPYDFDQMSSSPITTLPSTHGALTASIDEESYFVDAGDVFLIKIDVEGPAFQIYNPMVTPDGFLFLPNVPSIYVRHQVLKEVKNKIVRTLQKVYSRAIIEAYLFQLHPIRVSIIGDLPAMQKLILFSSNRLADAVNEVVFLDTLITVNQKLVSFRKIKLNRNKKVNQYDLLEYKFLSDYSQNPYLIDNDIIEIQLQDTISNIISVEGAVINPGKFEYKQGDNLKKALLFCGELTTAADSNRIELIRYVQGSSQFNKINLVLPSDSAFALKGDDKLYVRRKAEYHLNYSVKVEGEVFYPGNYMIHTGKSKLTDVINQAGGFTTRASLKNAMVLRSFEVYKSMESGQVSSSSPMNVSQLEFKNFRFQNRENRFLINLNFEKLFIKNDMNEDIVLFNDDLIVIPEITRIVFLSGGVKSPGSAIYHEGWSYSQYIESVGGYSELARKSRIKIVKSKTGKWLDADDVPVEEGDIIYIPERDERDWWKLSKEGLLVLAQIGGIALVLYTMIQAK